MKSWIRDKEVMLIGDLLMVSFLRFVKGGMEEMCVLVIVRDFRL